MRYALDTGFFFVLIDDPNRTVRDAWTDLRSENALGIVSGSVLFELRRHALVGRLASSKVDLLLERSKEAFLQSWMDTYEDFERAARLSHGEGLSMADALVLRAALEEDADRLYTNDYDLLNLKGFGSLELIEV